MNTARRDTEVVFIDPQNYHGCPAGTDHDRDVPEIPNSPSTASRNQARA